MVMFQIEHTLKLYIELSNNSFFMRSSQRKVAGNFLTIFTLIIYFVIK